MEDRLLHALRLRRAENQGHGQTVHHGGMLLNFTGILGSFAPDGHVAISVLDASSYIHGISSRARRGSLPDLGFAHSNYATADTAVRLSRFASSFLFKSEGRGAELVGSAQPNLGNRPPSSGGNQFCLTLIALMFLLLARR